MFRSIGFKLTLAFCAVSLIGILIVSLLAARVTETQVRSMLDRREQEQIAEELGAVFAEVGSWREVDRQIQGRYSPRSFVVVNEENNIVLPGMRLQIGQRVPQETKRTRTPIEANGRIVGYIVSFIPDRDDQRAPNQAQNQATLDTINRSIVIGALSALAASFFFSLIMVRWLTKPIHDITTASRLVAQGNLEQRVPVRTGDELGELATAFNNMTKDLAHSEQQRRQLTADIAHDLRTPLSLILGHSEAISDGVLPATPETLTIIHDEARRLNHLIEDLRTLTLSETGELTLQKRPINPTDLLNRAGMAHQPKAREKAITLTIEPFDTLPLVKVDPRRIGQVLDNLVSNAIRYTPKNGRIFLNAQRQNDTVQFSIRDNGPGIKPDDLRHIFDRFYRANRARTRTEGGSGLGLAIAKSLVVQHNGRIWAESQVGEGTVFHFTLPTAGKN